MADWGNCTRDASFRPCPAISVSTRLISHFKVVHDRQRGAELKYWARWHFPTATPGQGQTCALPFVQSRAQTPHLCSSLGRDPWVWGPNVLCLFSLALCAAINESKPEPQAHDDGPTVGLFLLPKWVRAALCHAINMGFCYTVGYPRITAFSPT